MFGKGGWDMWDDDCEEEREGDAQEILCLKGKVDESAAGPL